MVSMWIRMVAVEIGNGVSGTVDFVKKIICEI